jgi:SPP1 gp7 family putative phage head morphogenesis protein
VAKQVRVIVQGFASSGKVNGAAASKALTKYAELIDPWARSVAGYMLADVARRDANLWKKNSKEMGVALRAEIDYAPTGALLQERLAEQVHLIKSLPLDAAERVHDLTLEGLVTSTRAKEIAQVILAIGDVTEARARLIARTEVARTASMLTQVRAEYVGSDGYIWRTAGDSDVRDSHAEMEGKYVRWAKPPKLSDGTVTHAGQIYNCRCYAEPVLPDYD